GIGPADSPVGDQLGNDGLGRVHRDCEPDADVAAAGGKDLAIDTNQFALRVQEWASRVSRIDGRIRLDDVVDELSVFRANRAPQGADNTCCEGTFQSEGIPNCKNFLSDLQVSRAAQLDDTKRLIAWIYSNNSQVVGGVGTNDARLEPALV